MTIINKVMVALLDILVVNVRVSHSQESEIAGCYQVVDLGGGRNVSLFFKTIQFQLMLDFNIIHVAVIS